MAALKPAPTPTPTPTPPLRMKIKIAIASSISALIALGLVISAYTLLDISSQSYVPRPSLLRRIPSAASGHNRGEAMLGGNAWREEEPRSLGDRLIMPHRHDDNDDEYHHQQQQQQPQPQPQQQQQQQQPQQPQPQQQQQQRNISSASATACEGRYVYIYDLPREFNEELVDKCRRANDTWDAMCGNLDNAGYGPIFTAETRGRDEAESGGASGVLVPEHAWYLTEQFAAEMLFHGRLAGSYPCITREPEEAALFYVPYYAGMDAALTLFSPRLQERDRLAQRLAGWLSGSAVWTRFGRGRRRRRHFVVLGRTTWDFARSPASDSGWGTAFSSLPDFASLSKLLIERNAWRPDELAVPYPTSFHPSSDADVELWLSKVRSSKRELLCSFVGSKTRGSRWAQDLRAELSAQCSNASDGGWCRQVACGGDWLPGTVDCAARPDRLASLFLGSAFCLQPPGDTATRKSFFDALVAGCVPVVFSDASARDQYLWHLPRDAALYSVLLDGDLVIGRKVDVVAALRRIVVEDAPRLRRMQDAIARLIPRLVYALPRNSISDPAFRDAVDVSIDHLLLLDPRVFA